MDHEYTSNNRSGAVWCGGIVMDSMYRDDCTLRSETRGTRQKTKKGRQMEKRTEKRSNRFSGESIQLTKKEADKHDKIFYHEALATAEDKLLGTGASKHWQEMRNLLDWFMKNNAKAYMVLLD